jgi:hypothetical protein
LLILALLANTCPVNGQSSPTSKPLSVTLLKAVECWTSQAGITSKAGILVEGDRIKEVGRTADIESHAPNANIWKRFCNGPGRASPITRELGVKISNGFDASEAEEQGKNAREIIASE